MPKKSRYTKKKLFSAWKYICPLTDLPKHLPCSCPNTRRSTILRVSKKKRDVGFVRAPAGDQLPIKGWVDQGQCPMITVKSHKNPRPAGHHQTLPEDLHCSD